MRILPILILVSLTTAATARAWNEGVIVTSDFDGAGAVASFAREAPWAVAPDRETIHDDARGRWHDGLLYVINRGGADNVQVLDPAAGYDTVRQYSLGLGRNLQDIVFDDEGEAYVACYDQASLLRIDPLTGQILQVISTAAFADADGLPETSWLLAIGDRLFITCERLNRPGGYQPVGDSYLLVFDMDLEQWVDAAPGQPGVQGIRLAGADPYGEPRRDGDRILVPCVGVYTLLDAGVDVVDPAQLTSLGFEITGAQLGGDPIDLELGAQGRRHVIVSNPSFVTSLRRYDPASGQVVTLAAADGYDYFDLAFDGDFQIFLADRSQPVGGLRVFDAVSGSQLTSGAISCGLPPASFALPVAPPVAVGEPVTLAGGLRMGTPAPNPANPMASIAFTAPPGTAVTLRVVDLRGRLVRREVVRTDAAGDGRWTFDGRDAAGRELASGVYRIVAQSDAGVAARSLTVVR